MCIFKRNLKQNLVKLYNANWVARSFIYLYCFISCNLCVFFPFPFIFFVLCINIIYMYSLYRRASPFKPLGFLMSLLFLKFIFAHAQNVSIVQLLSRINKLSIQFNSMVEPLNDNFANVTCTQCYQIIRFPKKQWDSIGGLYVLLHGTYNL